MSEPVAINTLIINGVDHITGERIQLSMPWVGAAPRYGSIIIYGDGREWVVLSSASYDFRDGTVQVAAERHE